MVIDRTPIPYSSTHTIHNTSHSISNHYDLNMSCVSSISLQHILFSSSFNPIHSINISYPNPHTQLSTLSLRNDIVMNDNMRDCLESVWMIVWRRSWDPMVFCWDLWSVWTLWDDMNWIKWVSFYWFLHYWT